MAKRHFLPRSFLCIPSALQTEREERTDERESKRSTGRQKNSQTPPTAHFSSTRMAKKANQRRELNFHSSLFAVLKEEPDDAANLTLSATSSNGGASISLPVNNMCSPIALHRASALNEPCLPPLDDSTPLFGEIFDELILPNGYGTLLSDDVSSIDSQSSKINIDPFMSYRDESCDNFGTPNLLSPDTLAKVNAL